MKFSKLFAVLGFLVLCFSTDCIAKPTIKIAPDGFPTGQSTPEGAAADLARAFIARDEAQFRNVCVRPWGRGRARADYTAYLNGASGHLRNDPPTPDDPKKILQVFAARHLTRSGPASYGYAGFDFQDVMFVDVEVMLNSGQKHERRTMVIEDHDGKWYAQPVPDADPLLSYGIYEEKPSVQSFRDVYEITQ